MGTERTPKKDTKPYKRNNFSSVAFQYLSVSGDRNCLLLSVPGTLHFERLADTCVLFRPKNFLDPLILQRRVLTTPRST